MFSISWIGSLVGLILAIILIVKKVPAVYSLVCAALVAGLMCGLGLTGTIKNMVDGAMSMMSPVLRILCSGLLVGALIKTGAATKIAITIVKFFGKRYSLLALSVATMIICCIGVFIDIAVITVAPIGLAICKQTGFSKSSVLLAMIGGGKAGNIISPNPNTIAVAQNFNLDLFSVISINILPAIMALVITVVLASLIRNKFIDNCEEKIDTYNDIFLQENKENIKILQAIIGPVVVVVLLSLRPLCNITIDPLVALPIGAMVCFLVTGYFKQSVSFIEFGLSKVAPIAILLIGTGTLAGIIKASNLQEVIKNMLFFCNIPPFLLASMSGILFAGATASTTAGATIASQTFAQTLCDAGVLSVNAAAMIHAGSTVIDSLPHGSFFHATSGCVDMSFRPRLRLIFFEALIGLTSTLFSIVVYLIILFFCE